VPGPGAGHEARRKAPKARSVLTVGSVAGKKSLLNANAAAVAWMKKSYLSIAEPISAVIASLAVEGRSPGDWSPKAVQQ
jgi:hypothetical protein